MAGREGAIEGPDRGEGRETPSADGPRVPRPHREREGKRSEGAELDNRR